MFEKLFYLMLVFAPILQCAFIGAGLIYIGRQLHEIARGMTEIVVQLNSVPEAIDLNTQVMSDGFNSLALMQEIDDDADPAELN